MSNKTSGKKRNTAAMSLEDRYLGETGEEEPLHFPEDEDERAERKSSNRLFKKQMVKPEGPKWDSSDDDLATALKATFRRGAQEHGGGKDGEKAAEELICALVDRLPISDGHYGGVPSAENRTSAKIDRLVTDMSWTHHSKVAWNDYVNDEGGYHSGKTFIRKMAPHSFLVEHQERYEKLLHAAKIATSSTAHQTQGQEQRRVPALLYSSSSSLKMAFALPPASLDLSDLSKTWGEHDFKPLASENGTLKLRATRNSQAHPEQVVLVSIGMVSAGTDKSVNYDVEECLIVPFLWLETAFIDDYNADRKNPGLPEPAIFPDYVSLKRGGAV